MNILFVCACMHLFLRHAHLLSLSFPCCFPGVSPHGNGENKSLFLLSGVEEYISGIIRNQHHEGSALGGKSVHFATLFGSTLIFY